MNTVFPSRFPWVSVLLATVLPPGSGLELPLMPPIPWTDNAGSLANKYFGGFIKTHTAADGHLLQSPPAAPSTMLALPD